MPAAVKSADGKDASEEKSIGLFWVQRQAVLCLGEGACAGGTRYCESVV